MIEFQKIVTMVFKEFKINIKNRIIAISIALRIKIDVNNKHSNVTNDNLFKLATEQFNSNKSEYIKWLEFYNTRDFNKPMSFLFPYNPSNMGPIL